MKFKDKSAKYKCTRCKNEYRYLAEALEHRERDKMNAKYFRDYFNVWHDGFQDAIMLEQMGICVNHGYSKELRGSENESA